MIKMQVCTRLGVSLSELPPGGVGQRPPDSAGTSETTQTQDSGSIEHFLRAALTEAVPFIDGVAPKSGEESTWKSKGSPKRFTESDALVYSSEKTVSATGFKDSTAQGKGRTETWFCRRSCHRNSAEKGTASWDEFKRAFFEHHAEIEKEYVPTVMAVRKAIKWKTESIEIELNGEKWLDFTFEVWEMKHRIDPKPLNNRTFTTIQLTARLDGVQEFIMIQIPISDFEKSLFADYAHDKSLVVGAYTAVERVRIIPETAEIEWIMATASDAKGNLPQFVQNLAVPGELAKDVQKFLGWIPSQR